MVMLQTNLVIVPANNLYMTPVLATQVDICDLCGGLFARPGGQFVGLGHSH